MPSAGLLARELDQFTCTVRTSGYSDGVSEPAAEMPMSDARDHLADVVNRAVYGGEATYLTRRGRRLALVVSAGQLAADQARAAQEVIDEAIELAEDTADKAVIIATQDDHESGAKPVQWEQVKADLGL